MINSVFIYFTNNVVVFFFSLSIFLPLYDIFFCVFILTNLAEKAKIFDENIDRFSQKCRKFLNFF